MKTTRVLFLSTLLAAVVAVPAMARGPGGAGGGRGVNRAQNAGVCPFGFEPGNGNGIGRGAGVCDGTQQRLRLRDGSCLTQQQARQADQSTANGTNAPARNRASNSGASPRSPSQR